ncbi:ATP-grasp domain-containing protein [Lysinibacillus louembei]|uniref:ATP-grasp domain-containing protein n=1 Tax=Lysinibacillus louembei TaxID=1470088 RepID=A0ABZ0RWJ3_9BACI|nr:ATP-grasp domain-containing protein [Lysinibacillus louembei]WPK11318.1 ATP-grasp domain-containing protein [Lysinibacillus louembei]
MKTIVFIGTNKSGSSREAIKAAEGLGYFTVLFTNNEKQFQQRREYVDVHKMVFVDITNMEAMRTAIRSLQKTQLTITSIVSFTDPYVHTASQLCDEFCKNYAQSDAIASMEDKEVTRQHLQHFEFTPKFFILHANDMRELPKMSFPLIVKSPKSTGSKDVLFALNKKQLTEHIASLQEKYPQDTIMIEEYIDGPQYLVETIIYNGEPHIIALIEQDITQGKRFIITGYTVLARVPEKMQDSLQNIVTSITESFRVKNGAMHLELRLTKNGWKLIEINPRISGGAMNHMLEAAFGFNLVKETLKLLTGEQPNIEPLHQRFVYTKYLVVERKGILERVTGRNKAKNSRGVVEVYIKPRRGTLLIPPLSMGHRYAYVIATGNSKHEAKRNAYTAAKKIHFHLKI